VFTSSPVEHGTLLLTIGVVTALAWQSVTRDMTFVSPRADPTQITTRET
jgi:hypothetical protein